MLIFLQIFLFTSIQYGPHVFLTNLTQKQADKLDLPSTFHNLKSRPTFFFGFISMKNSPRRSYIFEKWVKQTVLHGHTYAFCADQKFDEPYNWVQTSNLGLSISINRNQNINRMYKRLSLANYFLHSTSATFAVICTDDVLADPERIETLVIELASKYDTNKDLMVKGNCMYINSSKELYIQGGTGFIISRAFARRFLEIAPQWIKITNKPDDILIENALHHMGLSSCNASSPYMIGHEIRKLQERKQNPVINISQLPDCPNFYDDKCGQGVFPIEKSVFIHPETINKNSNQEMAQFYDEVWDEYQSLVNSKIKVGWYNIWPTNHICKLQTNN